MDWEPAHADHSIDRVSLTIALQNITAGDLDELIVAARRAGESHEMKDRAEFIEPVPLPAPPDAKVFRIDLGSIEGAPPRKVTFRQMGPDGKRFLNQLTVGKDQISIVTTDYKRWANFYTLVSDIFSAISRECSAAANVKSVQLQYADRFITQNVEADFFEVINRDSDFLPVVLDDKTNSFHVHTGWFDVMNDNLRLLTNVNIDVLHEPPDLPPLKWSSLMYGFDHGG